MKKNVFLSSLTCAALLSPLLLTGCQAVENFFGEAPSYRDHQAYKGTTTQHHSTNAGGTSTATASSTTSSTHRITTATTNKASYKHKTGSVPVEPPSARNVPSVAPNTAPNATSNTSGNVVPAAPAMAPLAAPSMTTSPTVGQ